MTEPVGVQRLAEAVVNNEAVDWDAAEASARSQEERDVIRGLAVVGRIAAAHGDDQPPPFEGGHPSRWGNLRVLERIGSGSYGAVFRAWDETLDREVALKLLPAAVAPSSTVLVEEARLLARVRHPNVVSVYGADRIGETAGIWMEFVRGRTLATIVRSDGPYRAEEAALIGADVCRAVAAVHAAGLVHRDIKAQNVIRETGGRIVLADLGGGLEQGMARITDSITGTPAYIAPEMLEGGKASSQTDVYSVGVLLFFLVTGTYPATGESFDAVRRHLVAGGRRLADLRPDLPAWFVRVVEQATDPDPGRRFRTAGALHSALQSRRETRSVRAVAIAALVTVVLAATGGWVWQSRGPTVLPFTSVAVLPFKNLSGDPARDILVEGITDDVIRALSATPGVRVISRTSSAYYAGRPQPIAAIARELGVEAVVEGSVTMGTDRVMVATRLVDARNDANVAEQRVERPSSELSELAQDVGGRLSASLHEAPPLSRRRPIAADVYGDYLRARHLLVRREQAGFGQARQLLERVVEAEPLFIDGHEALAETLILGTAFSVFPTPDGLHAARAAAERALTLGESSMAHAVLAYVVVSINQSYAEERFAHFERAIEIDPNNATARLWYALSLGGSGLYDRALPMIEEARRLDPLSKVIGSDTARLYYNAGRVEQSIAAFGNLLRLHPDFGEAHRQLAEVYSKERRYADAERSFERALELQGRNPQALGELAYVKVRLGKRSDAMRLRDELLAMPDTAARIFWSRNLALASVGQIDELVRQVGKCRALRLGDCGVPLERPGLEGHVRNARIVRAFPQ